MHRKLCKMKGVIMLPMIKYGLLTLKHKWFVFVAGLNLGVPIWKLIIHDWSKFLPSELPHYGRQFFGKADQPLKFALCWLKHQNRHPHHWEYWIPRTGHSRSGYGDNQPLPMPMWAVLEMMADWMGAGKAYAGCWPNPHNWEWLEENLDQMQLDGETRALIFSVWNREKEKASALFQNTIVQNSD